MNLSKIISASKPKSQSAEDYRTLKTNIQLLSVNKKIQIIMVASADSKEGRSTTASNLAITLGDSGKRTILLDCDYRNPNMHEIFGIPNEKGLTNLLLEEVKFQEKDYFYDYENLYIITLGEKITNYPELLSSEKLNKFLQMLKERFEYIIIDTPPITLSADAQIISKYTDACIFVVQKYKTDKKTIILGKEILQKAGADIIGVVLNKTGSSTKKTLHNKKNTKTKTSKRE